jgi:hypothetical protein
VGLPELFKVSLLQCMYCTGSTYTAVTKLQKTLATPGFLPF